MKRWDFSKLADFVLTVLPRRAQEVIQHVGATGEKLGFNPYLVGGGARDLIRSFIEQIAPEKLAARPFDLDFAVEGDAISLARTLAEQGGGKVRKEERFLTARWEHPSGYLVDLATTRTEDYPVPGQLPEVTGGATIYEDLLRRDFTVNALAISVGRENFGELVDPAGGVGDNFLRCLRVLHPSSFLDDPTRVFRALRYSTGLNYLPEENTALLMQQALEEDYLDLLSPERVRNEIACILREPTWFGIMWSAVDWGLLQAVHPAWSTLPTTSGEDAEVLGLALRTQAEVAQGELVPPWLVKLSWLLVAVPVDELSGVLNRVGVYPRLARHMVEAREVEDEVWQRLNHDGFPRSRIYRVGSEYSRKTLFFVAFNSYLTKGTEALRRNLLLYLRELSPRRNLVDGHRLIEMGLPAGPLIEKVQDEIWWRYLDGGMADEEVLQSLAKELVSQYTSD